MDYSCTSKYFLTNQIEKTTTKIIIKMLMILDFILVLISILRSTINDVLSKFNSLTKVLSLLIYIVSSRIIQ